MRKTISCMKPSSGDTRRREWFALFPVTIMDEAGTGDRRWLERVTVEQRYETTDIALAGMSGTDRTRHMGLGWRIRNLARSIFSFSADTVHDWVNVRFVDETLERLRDL